MALASTLSNIEKPNVPKKLQIALQGGGAKLSALLAAMESVQELQHDGLIKVTRVAGTSAGSIVACLFAAGVNLGEVRERLKAQSVRDWERHFPKDRMKALWKLGTGRPIWSNKLLEAQLGYFFARQRVTSLQSIEDEYGIAPIVVATDLSDGKKVVYRGDKPIISALIDSCAIPYCFSVWNRSGKGVVVDGGICDNLPSDELDSDEGVFGEIVGISFDEVSNPVPNTFLGFTFSLLNTAMNHSIARAKRKLGTSKVFSIQTKLDTFDFPKAFSDSSDEEYKRVKYEARDWFSDLASAKPIINNVVEIAQDEWELLSKEYMTKLNSIYDTHHLPSKLKYLKTRLEVTARCLEASEKPDFVQYELEFTTLGKPVYCHRIALSKTEADSILRKVEVVLYGPDADDPIQLIYVPLLSLDAAGKEQKTVLIHFIPELPPNSGPYTLKCTDTIQDFVGLLKSKKKDFLKVTPFRSEGTVNKMEIVAHIPNAFPKVTMYQRQGLGTELTGAAMSKSHFLKYPDYESIGWQVNDLPPNTPFRVELELEGDDGQPLET